MVTLYLYVLRLKNNNNSQKKNTIEREKIIVLKLILARILQR